MATLDEGVHNLDQLCTQLADASQRLQAHSASLDDLEEALSGLQERMADETQELHDDLEDGLQEIDDAVEATVSAVRELSDATHTATDEQLEAAGSRAEDAAAEISRVEQVTDPLDGAFTRLDDTGFQVLDTAAGDLAAGTAALGEQSAQAFADIERALQDAQSRLGQERGQTESAFTDAEDALLHEERNALEEAAGASVEGWSEVVPAAVAEEEAALGPRITSAYEAFGQAADGDADKLIATVDAAVEDLQAEAAAQCQRMEEAVERALSGALAPLAEQAAAMAATLDSGRGLAEAIAAQAHDLEIAPRIVAEIERLLQAVE